MKNKLQKHIVILLCICAVLLMAIPVGAKENIYNYEWGHKYSWENEIRTYQFTLSQKSNVFFKVSNDALNGPDIYIRDAKGRIVNTYKDFVFSYDRWTDTYTGTFSRVLKKGTYQIYVRSDCKKCSYSLFMFCEPAISLSQPQITGVKRVSSDKLTLKVSPVKNCKGYQIQYSTSPDFKKAKVINIKGTKATISKMPGAKTFYVRVRAYAAYRFGGKVYSAWSPGKAVKTK